MASSTASPPARPAPFNIAGPAGRVRSSIGRWMRGDLSTDATAPALTPAPARQPVARTVAAVGLLGTLLVMATLGWVAWGQWHRTVASGERSTARAAFFLAEHAARLFEASDLALERSKELVDGRSWDVAAADPFVHDALVRLRDELRYVDDLWLNDADGRIRQTSFSFPAPDGNASGRAAFIAHVEGALGNRLFAAERIVGSVTGEPTLMTSRRIADPDGTLRGVAFATLSVDYFTDLWSRAPLPDGARAALFSSTDGTVLSRWPVEDGARQTGLSDGLSRAIAARPEGGAYRDADDTSERLGGYARVGEWPVYVRVSLSRAELWGEWWREVRPSLLFAALALAGLGALALFATHQVRRAERDRVALRREVAGRTAELRAEAHTLETINRASRELSGEIDREDAVQRVVDLGRSLSGAEFGAFFYDRAGEEGERIGLYALSGASRSAFEHFDHPRKTALFAPTFEGREAIRADDIAVDPRYGGAEPHHGMPAGHLPVRSYLAVPVISRTGTVHGALLFGHGEPGRFTERHEALVRGIAAQAAIVMDNAALFADAQGEIDRRRRSEERQHLLIRELHHRVKNTLATVRAIASISGRTAPDVPTFTRGLSDRLQALGQTHTLLIDGAWNDVGIADLIDNELGPYTGGKSRDGADGGRIAIDGPDLRITPDRAVPLGMALHELTTNAAKHGALSVPMGRVTVSWRMEDEAVHLRWTESGGPPVRPPERRGFGSTLLDRVLSAQLGASIEARFEPEGLDYRITFPLGDATERDRPGAAPMAA